VLIGKGITFDSGGLSLKPNDGMKLMKTDMAGGAAVIAAMSALARLGVRARVTGLVAAAENLPSGTAMRVGDVITHYGGQTVEVLNTDAEGRLVLADALAYADDVLAPDLVVDLATLTGAARVALGTSIAALYATDDELATALLDAGTASGDRLWRMPLAGDYRDALDSPWRTWPTWPGRAAGPDPSTPPCSCASSPAAAPGPTWTSPARPGPLRRRGEHQGRHRLRHPAAAAVAGG
jgi:Leucyl aminopeptidase